MKIKAQLENSFGINNISWTTNDSVQNLTVPSRQTGFGSSINGGEFLMLAVTTCFCNDIYREAQKRAIKISKVVVEVSGEFGAEGEAGYNLVYNAEIEGDASDEDLKMLIVETDKVAEIHNTLRAGVAVKLQRKN